MANKRKSKKEEVQKEEVQKVQEDIVEKKEVKEKEVDDSIASILDGLSSGDFGDLAGGTEEVDMKMNEVLENINQLNNTAGVNSIDNTVELVKWLYAKNEDKPVYMEKLLSDGDNRIKEASMIITLNSMFNLPKINALKQTVLDNIIDNVNSMKFLTVQEKLGVFSTLDNAEKNAQERAFKYIQMARDFSSMPTIYRQLVDRLMIIPDDKVPRLKQLPDLIELPDELWDRIITVVQVYNKR